MNKTQIKNFHSKIDIPYDNMLIGCWEWNAGKNKKGYGMFNINQIPKLAHRLSYLLWYGKYPDNCALHYCDNSSCVNPLHLWDGTVIENNLDMLKKGRNHIPKKWCSDKKNIFKPNGWNGDINNMSHHKRSQ
jgi:hypothetical protein